MFSEYQRQATKTAVFPEESALFYLGLGLANEAGEVAGKLKKLIRDKGGVLGEEGREALKAELGDVLWYLAVLADRLGLDLAEVAAANLAKLADRAARGTLKGDGDWR